MLINIINLFGLILFNFFEKFQSSIPFILSGAKVTLYFASVSFTFGFLIGFILSAVYLTGNKFLKFLVNFYVSIFRGTPVILQLGLLYYSAKPIFGIELSVNSAGILCFSLNSAAYVSEILKAGFNAVPKIQAESCKVLGIPKILAIKDILGPQSVKIVLPSLINEMVDLIKESAVISTISGVDLMRRAYIVASEHHAYFEPFIIVGFIYYIMVFSLTTIIRILEKCFK